MKYNEMPLQMLHGTCTITLAGIEFADTELDWMWENGVRYIVKQRQLLEIRYSQNYQLHYYVQKIFTFAEPQTNRGRHWALTAHEVNVSYQRLGIPELIE